MTHAGSLYIISLPMLDLCTSAACLPPTNMLPGLTLPPSPPRYHVPMPGGRVGEELTLLKGINGCFRPKVLTALMGASGAGKQAG